MSAYQNLRNTSVNNSVDKRLKKLPKSSTNIPITDNLGTKPCNPEIEKNANSKMSLEEYFFQPMTDKMKAFYNNSWGGETFDADDVKRKMSSTFHK